MSCDARGSSSPWRRSLRTFAPCRRFRRLPRRAGRRRRGQRSRALVARAAVREQEAQRLVRRHLASAHRITQRVVEVGRDVWNIAF